MNPKTEISGFTSPADQEASVTNTVRVCPTGELTIYTVTSIKHKLSAALADAETDTVEFDLSHITEADTAGLQLMMLAQRHPGKTVRFIDPAPSVRRLIDLANLASLFGLRSDLTVH